MPIDPNIALQVKGFQLDNPMDVANKAMTMRQLALQGRSQERALNDDQALRDAYRNNTVIGADGKATINRQGLMSDMLKTNPAKAPEIQKALTQADLDEMNQKHEIAKNLVWSINGPEDYAMARQKGVEMRLQNMDKWPEQFDPNFVKTIKMNSLKAEEQLAQQNKDREFKQKATEIDVRRKEVGGEKAKRETDGTITLLEQMRGSPAVAQAEKDLYSVKKAKGLISMYSDPNNLSMPQVQLLAGEIAKIAQGGAPTMHELEGLTPNSFRGKFGEAVSKFTNKPTAANAAAFVKQYSDYLAPLEKDAKEVVTDRYGRILDSKKRHLDPEDYKILKNKYLDRFNEEPAQGPGTDYDNMHTDDLTKAYTEAKAKAKMAGGE